MPYFMQTFFHYYADNSTIYNENTESYFKLKHLPAKRLIGNIKPC